MKGGRGSLSTITLCTGALSISGSRRDSETDTMSSDIVTSSHGDKKRARSATKAISQPLNFDGVQWLKQPKLGHKAMLVHLIHVDIRDFSRNCPFLHISTTSSTSTRLYLPGLF